MSKAIQPDVRLDTSLEMLLGQAGAEAAPGVLATLVATAGSTYRKPGARMLITGDGTCRGLLSGGCLEADLRLHAQQVLESGAARAVEYDLRGPDDILFGIGAGCEGAIRVLLEPAGRGTLADAALLAAGQATRVGRSTSLVAVHQAANLPLGTYGAGAGLPHLPHLPPQLLAAADRALAAAASCAVNFGADGACGRAFVQFLAPPPHLLVCGAGPDAEPVVSSALALGWRVSLVDHRPAYAVAQRFPGADLRRAEARELCAVVDVAQCHAAVIMSHHLPSDVAYLHALAAAGAPGFVGILGPRARRLRIVRELGDDAAGLVSRLHGPVGLDIGAVTPQGIALSIISQIHAWLAKRRGCPLTAEA